MKKYVKPDVAFEGFELSQHIAGGCTIMMNLADTTQCSTSGEGIDITKGTFSPNSVCTTIFDENVWQEYCYFTGDGMFVFFNS